MNKKNIIIIIISVLGVILTAGIIFFINPQDNRASDQDQGSSITSSNSGNENDSDKDYTYIPPTLEGSDTKTPTIVPTPTQEPEAPFVPATEMDLEPSSITVFVNKEFALPKSYKPEKLVVPDVFFDLTYYDERTLMRPEAAEALGKLFTEANAKGYSLCGVSGYRSYSRQYNIFTNNILTKGKDHTLKYSAVPGTSEHQTGLAIDVSCASLDFDLSSTFSETPEGLWLAQNAYRFGYTIRYPKDKGDITGYAYEPWHIRYVGKGLAKYLYENDLTLEEYYKYVPGKDFDFEALYADLINIKPSISPMPTGGTGVVIGENGEIIDGGLGDEVTPTGSAVTPTGSSEEPTGSAITVIPTPEDIITVTPTVPVTSEDGNPGDGAVSPTPSAEDGGMISVTPTPAE